MNKALLIRGLLKSLNKSFETIMSRNYAKMGLTLPQVSVLRQIHEDPKTIGQISKVLELSYSTVSGIIDRLERDLWVRRIRDNKDRRVIWIQKADRLDELKRQMPASLDTFYRELLQDLSEEEMDQIINALQILTRQLEKKVEENNESAQS